MTEPKKRNSTSLMLLLLYALLIASLLVLTLAGARLYSDTTHTQSSAARFRIFKAKRQRAAAKGTSA